MTEQTTEAATAAELAMRLACAAMAHKDFPLTGGNFTWAAVQSAKAVKAMLKELEGTS